MSAPFQFGSVHTWKLKRSFMMAIPSASGRICAHSPSPFNTSRIILCSICLRVVGKPEVDPLPRRRCEVSLAMIHPVRGGRIFCGWVLRGVNANLDGMREAIANGRRKRQAVFMTDELRNLRIDGVEFFGVPGEISASARSFGHPLQNLIGLLELLRDLRGICRGNFFLAGGRRISQSGC